MESNYWSRLVRGRISRRRALIGTGAGALGAAFLAACGSDDSPTPTTPTQPPSATGPTGPATTGPTGPTGPSTPSGLLAEPVNTLAQAQPGGTLRDWFPAEITNFDALQWNTASTVNQISVFSYPRFLKFALVEGPAHDGGSVEGETMLSYEISPDALTYTFKIRDPMIWDERAPTNGRQIDAEDVLFSWNKFAALNASSPNFVYHPDRAPGAAVEGISAPDDRTIVLTLRRPEPALLTLLAGWDQLYVMPRESDGGFNPGTEVRGHGPWLMEEYVPSSHVHWVKNPNYYNEGRPFPDRLERTLVPEYATRLAQFIAGNLHFSVASPQDVVQTKKDVPETQIFQAGAFGPASAPNVIFGYEDDSVFRDTRVRQAVSMSIDRDAYIDVVENRDRFAAEGIDIEVGYNTVLSAAWGEFWLDPQDPAAFGEQVKYLQYHPDESVALLSAAGYPNGVEFDFLYNSEATYGPAYQQTYEIYQGMFEEVGLRAQMRGHPYAQWLNNYHYGYIPSNYQAGTVSGFNGIGLAAERQRYTPALSLFGLMHPQGDAFHGAVRPDGTGPAIEGDPALNDLLERLRLEVDREASIGLTHDVIRYATENAIYVPKPGHSKLLTLWWPIIANNNVFNSSAVGPNIWAETRINWWLDSSKRPGR
jgi:peptide/nickel transport system substrate-binding protein